MLGKFALLFTLIGLFAYVSARTCPVNVDYGFLFGNACTDRRFGMSFALLIGIVLTVLSIAGECRKDR